MPNVQADRLRIIGARILEGAGAKPEHAAVIARHTVGANLAGHDSHGIILVPTYIDRIKRDHIDPTADYEVTRMRRSRSMAIGGSATSYPSSR